MEEKLNPYTIVAGVRREALRLHRDAGAIAALRYIRHREAEVAHKRLKALGTDDWESWSMVAWGLDSMWMWIHAKDLVDRGIEIESVEKGVG